MTFAMPKQFVWALLGGSFMDFKDKVEKELIALYKVHEDTLKELKELQVKQSQVEDRLAETMHQIYCLESVHRSITPPNRDLWVL